jgi:hypothetical protein
MRRDSAGVVDPALNETQGDEFEAEALAALNALWRDESERTDVIQPQHMSALVPVFGEVDPEQTRRVPDPDASTSEDPGWDDERELTEALDFDRLAPWHVPEAERAPDWALELTTSYDRPAYDAGSELDWDDGAELTHRIDPEAFAAARAAAPAKGLVFPRSEASTARGLPHGPQSSAATKTRARSSDRMSDIAARPGESSVQPRTARNAKRVGSETLPARVNRAKPARARPSGWPLTAAPASEQLDPQVWQAVPRSDPQPPAAAAAWPAPPPSNRATHASDARMLAAEWFGTEPPTPARSSHAPYAAGQASAGTTSRRPALRSASGQRVKRPSLPQPTAARAGGSQPSAAKSGPRRAIRPTAPIDSLPPAELERPAHTPRPRAGLWWAVSGCAFAAACVALRIAVSSGPAVGPELTSAPVETVRPRPEDTRLSLTSYPAGAQILVDGKDTGVTTPGSIPNLSPGLHAVELRLAGHYATGLPAVLEEGHTLGLPEVELRPLPAASLFSAPSAMPERAGAPPTRSIRRVARRTRTATDLGAAELAVAREPEPAAESGGSGLLQINSRPWARILVDGEFMGNTPQLRLRLPAGQHSVRLVNEPLHMSKTLSVTIRDGETLTKVETLSEDAQQSGVSIQGDDALAAR